MKDKVQISRFLSYILRHAPESIGLSLDAQGWGEISQLILLTQKKGTPLTLELINDVVKTNDKKRFAISEDGLFIRAVQGHSLKTTVAYQAITPPKILYHGTATRFIDSIFNQGLIPNGRQYVHLSQDYKTAVNVGNRHGKAVVLIVDSEKMFSEGFEFYQSDNGVWLTLFVPVNYLKIEEKE
ncbi:MULTISPECIES: RNA 2'-phosphotransferase [Proteus]|jgi:putative RNA 2'-phosphotransferase|uniref:Probable RNA 2'-phosphotransferase n=1 Tax=Proteus vulgaris TaxID=585 RepID=A0A379F4I7_PROVU|nr:MULTISPECIES: RNA 2'-phosphotransferase [Proteus]NBN60972.1 RNA 2'-phosphotransferase [Proteus sp. G2639]RNT29221.1 RNA 2'-phosphotransferase [Proteus mirabilis]AYY80528.1 RNA 2'-phosphotransferase [Proteus vulgaris]KGA59278.1 RNA 2'-phosphotransferase, Tpt1 / KptA family protein [Proteus vulgaris]MBG5972244.1 RNA 2'-phosphotransferase [Proteus vulgaris]